VDVARELTMSVGPATELEITRVDLRYEECRLRNPRLEDELLAEIASRGIERPLAGAGAESGWVLLDGFKRYRCARQLQMGSVPCLSLGSDEAGSIMALLRGPGQRPLSFLEEARFLKELQSVHGMGLAEMAAAVGRSKPWASMRLSALADMSPAVRDAIFRGSFPARAYLYSVRPFTRVNGADAAAADAFVSATGGRGLSTRQIARLAERYFRGTEDERREIAAGHLALALGEAAPAAASGTSRRERACLGELATLARTVAAVELAAADQTLSSAGFRAQAALLLEDILGRADAFLKGIRGLHDRCRAP
jgi:hypothetical protein